jgi:replicative DNA helicase
MFDVKQETEQIILGCLILDPDSIPRVESLLNENSFDDSVHKILWTLIVRIFNREANFDLLSFPIEMSRTCIDCVNRTPTNANVIHYAQTLKALESYRN